MIAARWARGVAQARFDPRWSAHGRAAPLKCNDEMQDDKFAATGVVLFGGNGVAPEPQAEGGSKRPDGQAGCGSGEEYRGDVN